MKKVSHKKVTKDCGKQLKISSFFISPKCENKTANSNRPSNLQNGKTKGTFTNTLPYKKLCEIDLTQEDDNGAVRSPLTPPKNQNRIPDCEKDSKIGNKICKNISPLKNCEKLNKLTNNIEDWGRTSDSASSPEIIPPTPPADRKFGREKGVKRKFDFSTSKNHNGIDKSGEKKKRKLVKSDFQISNNRENCTTGNGCETSKSPEKYNWLKWEKELKCLNNGNIAEEFNSNENIYDLEYKEDSSHDHFAIKCSSDKSHDNSKNENSKVVNGTENTNSSDLNTLFDDWEHDNFSIYDNELKLEKCTRCIITSIIFSDNKRQIELVLKESNGSASTKCVLQGSWAGVIFREADTISVLAKWNSAIGWVVTDTFGYVVLEPDTLVSSTALVGSLFCMRRSILADMFRGLDSESEIMVIGSLLHEILQEVLSAKVRKKHEIESIINEIISTRDFMLTLYSSKITYQQVKKQLEIFVPQIVKFVNSYITPTTETKTKDNWNGEITAIEDIEENIWATNIGLKGKVDVTVKVKKDSKLKVLPLELKTGRASFSVEHRGQLILYALMMTELGAEVDSGLLLYLREGALQEVNAGMMEKRDLILLRNELVRYMDQRKIVEKDKDGLLPAPCLPDPINHKSACNKCPYVTICSSALKESGLEKLSSEHPMNGIAFEATSHLKSEHIRFVFHWVGLLQLEESERSKTALSVKDIWILSPQEREKNGTCVSCLKLNGCVSKENSRYKHLFKREKDIKGIIGLGDYLIVSIDKRVSIASGFVTSISECEFSMLLERDLSNYKDQYFHIDRYESQNQLSFNLTNLGHLLEPTPECNRLRNMIISLELPVYVRLSSEVLSVSQDLLSGLNKGQKHAVLQALATKDYLLIKGMPGTGKSETLVSLIKLLVRLGQSILVTSHTHSAVDNILKRLPSTIDIVRLGSIKKVHPDVQTYSENNINFSSPDELENILNKKQVVGVTCLGSGHPLLRSRRFDVVLVDEATQVLLPTTLRPLFSASRFILVGDPKQLPPLVRSQQASDFGLNQSLFSYLDRPGVTAELSSQYRMNQTITDLANGLTYEGKLECANEIVKTATIKLNEKLEDKDFTEPINDWLSLALSQKLEHSVVVLDSGSVPSATNSNKREAESILSLVAAFTDGGILGSNIGVITPFQAQVALLKSTVTCEGVEISTVDTFQGRDKDIVIYSCTRSSHAKETGLLSDHNRLTVAITRARHKLIFVGDVQTLKGYATFQKLFSLLPQTNFIMLPQNDNC